MSWRRATQKGSTQVVRCGGENSAIAAVLLDIGGTLWPGSWSATEAIRSARAKQLQAIIAGFTSEAAAIFHRRLVERMSERMHAARQDRSYVQDTAGVIHEVAREFGLPTDAAIVLAVRQARRVSPVGHIELFPGALDPLRLVKDRGLRCVAVSNADWRGAEEYWLDFADLGLDGYFDAILTSVDIGFVKPHPAMFEAAVTAAGCGAAKCVVIGNKETSDITPPAALGMRTILVAIETPKPKTSRSGAVVRSLREATDMLRSWIDA